MDSTAGHDDNLPVSTEQRHFLFTYPRTASHLFMRMLSLHHEDRIAVHPPEGDDYFFMPSIEISEELAALYKSKSPITDEITAKFKKILQGCAEKLQDFILQSESEGKCIFIKEHVQFIVKPAVLEPHWTTTIGGSSTGKESDLNQTVLPADFLLTLRPTFLIRHPALTIPSMYRAYKATGRLDGLEDSVEMILRAMMSIQPVRSLFEWYKSATSERDDRSNQNQLAPIVIDASDLIHEPQLLLDYCRVTDLDMAKLVTEWEFDKATHRKLEGTGQAIFLSTVASSTGIIEQKTPLVQDIDVEVEHGKWCTEFGQKMGDAIKRLVTESLPDYQYLWSHRFVGKN